MYESTEAIEQSLQPTKAWFRKNVQPLWEKYLKPLAPFSCYLEIGVFEGESLLWAAKNLLGDYGTAEGVDPWIAKNVGPQQKNRIREARNIAFARCHEFNESEIYNRADRKIYLEELESYEFFLSYLSDIGKTYDIIYIDGDHLAPAALCDMVLAWRVLEKGGIFIVDDIHIRKGSRPFRTVPHTGEAWDAFAICHEGQFEEIYKSEMQVAVRKL